GGSSIGPGDNRRICEVVLHAPPRKRPPPPRARRAPAGLRSAREPGNVEAPIRAHLAAAKDTGRHIPPAHGAAEPWPAPDQAIVLAEPGIREDRAREDVQRYDELGEEIAHDLRRDGARQAVGPQSVGYRMIRHHLGRYQPEAVEDRTPIVVSEGPDLGDAHAVGRLRPLIQPPRDPDVLIRPGILPGVRNP